MPEEDAMLKDLEEMTIDDLVNDPSWLPEEAYTDVSEEPIISTHLTKETIGQKWYVHIFPSVSGFLNSRIEANFLFSCVFYCVYYQLSLIPGTDQVI